ncbi:pilus assembly protein CpaB [Nakamurella panacisegetis]|uniref:Pilus assembly protein CpaB n=1 Tax=Nakamurella panacisegetis TaxID=1090615 RepID=A0A1H0HN74_9ACTN|nr:RcpC/CpaB family pilus assembly protein [Nakamurella panacisegetis]SDO20666.1 pilus assembly protein CpaB [Nakamurella panacisegetis]
MIKSRMIAAVAAVLLAVVGTVVLLSYAHKNAAAAPAAPAMTSVWVATSPIPAGTPATAFAKLAALKAIPAAAVLPNTVTDLTQLAQQVALVPLVPGEQLLISKFGPPLVVMSSSTAVKIPPAFQQITILLRPEQVLGGHLAAGDTVGVFISLGEKNIPAARTHLTAQKVLVTRVEAQTAPPAAASATAGPTTSSTATPAVATAPSVVASGPATSAATPSGPDPTANVLVTLATTAHIAEKIVFGAEHGSIWLSYEPLTADESGTEIVDGTKVYTK